MRGIAVLAASGVLAATVVATSMGPAAAGCDSNPPLPDVRIRASGGEYQGDGIIDCNGGEALVQREVGSSARFEFRARNEEDQPKAIRLREGGDNTDPVEFKVRYKLAGNDVTEKLDGDGKVFNGIAPGKSTPLITMKIKVLAAADLTDVASVFVLAQHKNEPVSHNTDEVAAKVDVVP